MTEGAAQATSVAAPPKRRFVWVWVLVLLGVLIAFPRVTSHILVARAERRVAAAIENLPFKLVPVKDLASTWGPAPQPEDNAAPLVAEACRKAEEILAAPATEKPVDERQKSEPRSKEFERLQVIWGFSDASNYPEDEAALSPEELRQNAVLDEYFKKSLAKGGGEFTPEVTAAMEAKHNRPPPQIPQRDVKRAREFLKHFDEVRKLAGEAAQRPAYRRERDWSFVTSGKQVPGDNPSDVVNVILLDCAVEAEADHWEAAYASLARLFRLQRLFDQEPLFTGVKFATRSGHMQRFVATLLSRHAPSPAQANELSPLLQQDPTEASRRLRILLTGDCLQSYDICRGLWNPLTDNATSEFVRYYFLTDQAVFLESMGRIVRAADLPWREALAAMELVGGTKRMQTLAGVPLMSSLMGLPGGKAWAETFCGFDMQDRLNAVAFQVAAYHQAHGKYPETLAELPHADLLPRDPYTIDHVGESGKPLGYRVTEDGFMIWSVGPGGKDDIVLKVPPEIEKPAKAEKPEEKP